MRDDLSPAHVGGDDDLARIRLGQLIEPGTVLDGTRANDDSCRAGVEELVNPVGRSHAAADLNGSRRTAQNRIDETAVVSGAGRGVDIDHVKPAKAERRPFPPDGARV